MEIFARNCLPMNITTCIREQLMPSISLINNTCNIKLTMAEYTYCSEFTEGMRTYVCLHLL